jgi:hypothetical protein
MSMAQVIIVPQVTSVQPGGMVALDIQRTGNMLEVDGQPVTWQRTDGCHVDGNGTLINDIVNGTPQYGLSGAGGPDIVTIFPPPLHTLDFIANLPPGEPNAQINVGFSHWATSAPIWVLGQMSQSWAIRPDRASVMEFPISGGGGERTALTPPTYPSPVGKRFQIKIDSDANLIGWAHEGANGQLFHTYASNLLSPSPIRAAVIFFQHNNTGKVGGVPSPTYTLKAFNPQGVEHTPAPFDTTTPGGPYFIAPTGFTSGGIWKIRVTTDNYMVGEVLIEVGLPQGPARSIVTPAKRVCAPGDDVPLQVDFVGSLAQFNGQMAKWQKVTNCIVDGQGTLVANGNATPDSWGIAGAFTTENFASGDGYFEFQWNVDPPTDRVTMPAFQSRTGGLSDRIWVDPVHFQDIIYCWHVTPTACQIYEFGVLRATIRAPLLGERFRVAYEGGQIVYRQEGIVQYRSTLPLFYPAYGMVAFFYNSAARNNKLGGIPGPTYELRAYKANNVTPWSGTLVTPSPFTGDVFNAPPNVNDVGLYHIDAVTPNWCSVGDHNIKNFRISTISVEFPGGAAFVRIEPETDVVLGGSLVPLSTSVGGFLAEVSGALATFTNLTGAMVDGPTGTVIDTVNNVPAWGLSGARTNQSIVAGEGYYEFSLNVPPSMSNFFAISRTAGLTTATHPTSYTDFQFLIHATNGGILIYESGVLKRSARLPRIMDRCRIGYEAGAVVYRVNGEVIYRSDQAPVYPIWGGVAFEYHTPESKFGGIPSTVVDFNAYRESGELITPDPFDANDNFICPLGPPERFRLEASTSNFASGSKYIFAQRPFGYDNYWNETYPCPTQFLELWGEGTFKVNEMINDDQSAVYHIPSTNEVRRWRITWEALPEHLAVRLDNFYREHLGRGKAFFFWDYRINQYFDNARITAYEVGHRKRWARRRVIEVTHRPR